MFLYLLTFLKNNKGILKSNTILEDVYSYCTGATYHWHKWSYWKCKALLRTSKDSKIMPWMDGKYAVSYNCSVSGNGSVSMEQRVFSYFVIVFSSTGWQCWNLPHLYLDHTSFFQRSLRIFRYKERGIYILSTYCKTCDVETGDRACPFLIDLKCSYASPPVPSLAMTPEG